MQIGIIGCGFTADHYLYCLQWHPELKIGGATDRDPDRASKFCNLHSVKLYPSLEDMLADGSIEMVLTLTHSSGHSEPPKSCLNVGEPLSTEKPLATDFV